MQEHEYSVLAGTNRAAIGRTLSLIAAGVASVLVSVVLAAIDLARTLGWSTTLPSLINVANYSRADLRSALLAF